MPLILLLFVLLPQVSSYEAKVVAVLDGDTIEVLKDGKTTRIRLNGIDAPEKGQAFGNKAKEYTASLIAGKTVKVVPRDTDRYGRLVADIYVAPTNAPDEYSAWVNKAIVLSGFAWHYKRYSKDQELANAELQARKLKWGLWEESNPTPPWEWRKQQP